MMSFQPACSMMLALLCGVYAHNSAVAQPFEVRTITARFGGERDLGWSTATVLSLQLWQTLRKFPNPNPKHLDFGDGNILWYGEKLTADTHEEASAAARDLMAQQILWGHARRIDEEALVTAYLTIPIQFDFRSLKHERWELRREDHAGVERVLKVDIPQRAYSFEPIVLPSEVVQRYSRPDALVILSQPSLRSRERGHVGPIFKRIESRGEFARVSSGSVAGWVYLPQLGAHRTEIVDFIGGIIRIFRADWEGAKEYFIRVIENNHAPADVRTDSWLYLVRAKSELGEPAETEIEAALKLSPAAKRVVQYAVMHRLSACTTRPPECASRLAAARELLTRTRSLFPEQDEWYATSIALLPAP